MVSYQGRIFNAVIGTHFYQTYPDVLDQFVDSEKVKFILQPNSVFHPKVYLFWSSESWEVVIGSPNLTAAALTKNTELSILVTSSDDQSALKQEIMEVIGGYFDEAQTIRRSDAENYRKLRRLKTRNLMKIADVFGGKAATKPAAQSTVMSMEWKDYLVEIKKDKLHGFQDRLALIAQIRNYFKAYKRFNDMDLDVRKGIAGQPSLNTVIENWGWFGSMKGVGAFAGYINASNKALSLALDEIPLAGEVWRAMSVSLISILKRSRAVETVLQQRHDCLL